MVNNKGAFWKALIFTIVIFSIGILLGFSLENKREDIIETNLIKSEINLLDEQLRNRELENFNIDCNLALESTFSFADKIYEEALLMEKYSLASKFSSSLKIIHKRYDLLRMMLWMESIRLKENCEEDFHTVVYLYKYDEDDVKTNAEQSAMSRILSDIKNKHGDKILLIPIATNLNLDSINLMTQKYKIQRYPSLIIDEETVVSKTITLDELEKIIFLNNK